MATTCNTCNGTGWTELIGGEIELANGKRITATPERPVYRRCKVCQYERQEPKSHNPRRYGDD